MSVERPHFLQVYATSDAAKAVIYGCIYIHIFIEIGVYEHDHELDVHILLKFFIIFNLNEVVILK